jgi:hypothetical protein
MSKSENFPFNDWRSSFEEHPQFSVLKNHIDRAVQDLFLVAMRTQGEEFIYIFDSAEKIDDFANRMIKYWEVKEDYETCGEILSLAEELKLKWKNIPKNKKVQETVIREWLKSSF